MKIVVIGMNKSYASRQTKILFPGEAYQLSLFSHEKISYSKIVYNKIEEATAEVNQPSLFPKTKSQLELKLE